MSIFFLSNVSVGVLVQDGVKFVSIGSLFSELVAVSSKGELYQWKWSEPEPYRNTQVNSSTVQQANRTDCMNNVKDSSAAFYQIKFK